MNADVDLLVTTFVKALISTTEPEPIQIDGDPCLLVRGDVSTIVILFETRHGRAQFLESVEQARGGDATGSQIDPGVVHGPRGVIAMPFGTRIDTHWRTLKSEIYDGQPARPGGRQEPESALRRAPWTKA
jgi:hypothetical protein